MPHEDANREPRAPGGRRADREGALRADKRRARDGGRARRRGPAREGSSRRALAAPEVPRDPVHQVEGLNARYLAPRFDTKKRSGVVRKVFMAVATAGVAMVLAPATGLCRRQRPERAVGGQLHLGHRVRQRAELDDEPPARWARRAGAGNEGRARSCRRSRLPTHLELGRVEALRVHPTRRHRQHASGAGCTQGRQEQAGEQELAEDVARQRQLASVRRLAELAVQRTGVVDEHVERRVGVAEACGNSRRASKSPMSATS